MQLYEVTDRDGERTGELSFKASEATRALELLGKHRGMFIDRVAVSVDARPLQGYSVAELEAMASGILETSSRELEASDSSVPEAEDAREEDGNEEHVGDGGTDAG